MIRTATLVTALFAAACAQPGGAPKDQCDLLAHAHFLLAQNKDMGISEAQSLELPGAPAATQKERLRDFYIREAIRVVYAHPELDAAQIQALVRADCRIGSNGLAELPTLWPWLERDEGEEPPERPDEPKAER